MSDQKLSACLISATADHPGDGIIDLCLSAIGNEPSKTVGFPDK